MILVVDALDQGQVVGYAWDPRNTTKVSDNLIPTLIEVVEVRQVTHVSGIWKVGAGADPAAAITPVGRLGLRVFPCQGTVVGTPAAGLAIPGKAFLGVERGAWCLARRRVMLSGSGVLLLWPVLRHLARERRLAFLYPVDWTGLDRKQADV